MNYSGKEQWMMELLTRWNGNTKLRKRPGVFSRKRRVRNAKKLVVRDGTPAAIALAGELMRAALNKEVPGE